MVCVECRDFHDGILKGECHCVKCHNGELCQFCSRVIGSVN